MIEDQSARIATSNHPGLRNAFEKLPQSADRWTHRDDATPSKNDQIDYLLVSQALWPRLQTVEIERRGHLGNSEKDAR